MTIHIFMYRGKYTSMLCIRIIALQMFNPKGYSKDIYVHSILLFGILWGEINKGSRLTSIGEHTDNDIDCFYIV